jgi:hypothetical protein
VTAKVCSVPATAVLFLQALFIAWVIFGPCSRARPASSASCISFPRSGEFLRSCARGASPFTCLKIGRNKKEAGVQPYEGPSGFHYLDKLVYPDISTTSTVAGVVVLRQLCALWKTRLENPTSIDARARMDPRLWSSGHQFDVVLVKPNPAPRV